MRGCREGLLAERAQRTAREAAAERQLESFRAAVEPRLRALGRRLEQLERAGGEELDRAIGARLASVGEDIGAVSDTGINISGRSYSPNADVTMYREPSL